jgi:phospholipid/cholesterol/gamma-HCH transport system permease protein
VIAVRIFAIGAASVPPTAAVEAVVPPNSCPLMVTNVRNRHIEVPWMFGSVMFGVRDAIRFLVEEVGRLLVLLGRSVLWLFRPPFRFMQFLRQLDFVGVQSMLLIVFTGAFTGMVSALQGYNGMHRYGAESMVGATVALALCRELGPVIAALMVVSRVGSAITAELGSMRNTQQIDALSSMAVEPIQYLIVPRIVAATAVLPVLDLLFCFSGMLGAYLVSTHTLGIDGGTFMAEVRQFLTLHDVTHGMIKSVVFGLIISLVACYQGFYATGGAKGVGEATTRAVVISSVLILISDYMMTALMFKS